MRFITVRDLRGNSRRVWSELKHRRELIITSNGKPIAILSKTSEDTLEESLAILRSAKAMQAVAELQRRSVQNGKDKMTMREIDAEIRTVRKRRKSA